MQYELTVPIVYQVAPLPVCYIAHKEVGYKFVETCCSTSLSTVLLCKFGCMNGSSILQGVLNDAMIAKGKAVGENQVPVERRRQMVNL